MTWILVLWIGGVSSPALAVVPQSFQTEETRRSAGPARSLGLTRKGHLGVGADADVTIYPVRPDHGFLFSYPRYVIKGGAVVVEEGDVKDVTEGREFIVHPECDARIEDYIRPLFEKVYTMSFANYPVEMERLRRPEIVRPA